MYCVENSNEMKCESRTFPSQYTTEYTTQSKEFAVSKYNSKQRQSFHKALRDLDKKVDRLTRKYHGKLPLHIADQLRAERSRLCHTYTNQAITLPNLRNVPSCIGKRSRQIFDMMPSIPSTYNRTNFVLPSSFVVNYNKFLDNDFIYVERFCLFLGTLSPTMSIFQFSSALCLYLGTLTDRPLCKIAEQYVRDLLSSCKYENQSDNDDAPSTAFGIIKALQMARSSFAALAVSPFYLKILEIMGLVTSLGLCTFTKIPFTISGLKLFNGFAIQKGATFVDLLSAGLDFIIWFGEAGYRCFQTRSLKPLFFNDSEAQSLDEEYLYFTAAAPEFSNGNLDVVGLDPNAYYARLSALDEGMKKAYDSCNSPIEKNQLFLRRQRITQWIADYTITINGGALREAPFAMLFFGQSGVGKSTISTAVNTAVLNRNGFESDPTKVAVWNENDKFFSNYRSDVNTIVMDDLGNTETDFLESSPLVNIIKFVNNIPEYAVKADLSSKGKVAIRPKTVVVTTNRETLDAPTFSKEPVSILRRMNLHVTVRVKKEFTKDNGIALCSDKVWAYKVANGLEDEDIDDVWELDVCTVSSYKEPSKSVDQILLVPVIFNDKTLKNCSIYDLIEYACHMSVVYYARQKQIVAKSMTAHTRVVICSTCNCFHTKCKCDKTYDNQAISVPVLNQTEYDAVHEELSELYKFQYFDYTATFGSWFMNSDTMLILSMFLHYKLWTGVFRTYAYYTFLIILMRIILPDFGIPIGMLTIFSIIYIVINLCNDMVLRLRYLHTRMQQAPLAYTFASVRKYSLYAFTACFSIFAIARCLKKSKEMYDVQGNLAPQNDDDVRARDKEDNPWVSAVADPLPSSSDVSRTSDCKQILAKVGKNVVSLEMHLPDSTRYVNGVFITSNMLLLPKHAWNGIGEDVTMKIVHKPLNAPSCQFRARISRSTTVFITGTDLTLTYVSAGGSWWNMIAFLPDAGIRNGGARIIGRKVDGEIWEDTAKYKVGIVSNQEASFLGGDVIYTKTRTYSGMCMAPLVSDSSVVQVIGFHLGGEPNKRYGCFGTLSRTVAIEAMEQLNSMSGILIGASEGDFRTKLYDVQFFQGEAIHPKCPSNFQEPGHVLRTYGSVIGRSTYFSEVVTTPISDTVEKVCGIPNIWDKPKFSTKSWHKAMSGYATPSIGPYPSEIPWAVNDYLIPIIGVIRNSKMWQQLRPLSKEHTLCGQDGIRFIDKMPRNKSVGFPEGGLMIKHMTPSEIEYIDISDPYDLDEKYWEEVKHMEECALKGERSYPIFKASLKDEPTKITKDKVRVFTGASMAQKLLIRKYFLPLTRIICHNSLVSECAVGINAGSPEWDQMHKHITQHGTDRCVAGDFSAYDQRMSASITIASFDILIQMARECGYSKKDLIIMQFIVSDIICPMVAYNGTLVTFLAGNPSGQNLTVFINSLANSLLYRLAYRTASRIPNPPPFRHYVAAMFYGDDSVGCVSKDCTFFNNIEMSKKMDEIGMIFTPPDKSSEHTAFMTGEVEFLKRTSVYIPELKHYVGKLDEMSIYKSLHSVLKSKECNILDQCSQNIDGALREYFFHGREKYDEMLIKLREIAAEHDLSHRCKDLDVTFDDRVHKWYETYITKSN